MVGLLDWFTGGGDYADQTKIDPRYGVPMGDVRDAGINTLANISALLLAAGQGGLEPGQRAAYLAQLGQAGGGFGTDLYNASQRRLMQTQMQEKQREIEENRRLDEIIKDPAQLQGLGISPQQAQILGRSGIRQFLANTVRTPEAAEKARLEVEGLRTNDQLRRELNTQIDADSSLTPQQKILFKANPELYARTVAPGPKEFPNDVREYQFYVQQEVAAGRQPKSFVEYQVDLKRAGSQTINLGDTADKIAVTNAIKRNEAAIEAGEAAASRINQSNTIRALLDQGVITGFGTEGRVIVGQAAQALGFNQNDERLANTRTLLAALAQRSLDAAKLMQGQGAITGPERELLSQVAGSNVALGQDAIRKVLDIADRVDRRDLERGIRAAESMRNLPGIKENPLGDVYRIDQPKAYQRNFNVDGKTVQGRLGVDGRYYYTDPQGKRFIVEE